MAKLNFQYFFSNIINGFITFDQFNAFLNTFFPKNIVLTLFSEIQLPSLTFFRETKMFIFIYCFCSSFFLRVQGYIYI